MCTWRRSEDAKRALPAKCRSLAPMGVSESALSEFYRTIEAAKQMGIPVDVNLVIEAKTALTPQVIRSPDTENPFYCLDRDHVAATGRIRTDDPKPTTVQKLHSQFMKMGDVAKTHNILKLWDTWPKMLVALRQRIAEDDKTAARSAAGAKKRLATLFGKHKSAKHLYTRKGVFKEYAISLPDKERSHGCSSASSSSSTSAPSSPQAEILQILPASVSDSNWDMDIHKVGTIEQD